MERDAADGLQASNIQRDDKYKTRTAISGREYDECDPSIHDFLNGGKMIRVGISEKERSTLSGRGRYASDTAMPSTPYNNRNAFTSHSVSKHDAPLSDLPMGTAHSEKVSIDSPKSNGEDVDPEHDRLGLTSLTYAENLEITPLKDMHSSENTRAKQMKSPIPNLQTPLLLESSTILRTPLPSLQSTDEPTMSSCGSEFYIFSTKTKECRKREPKRKKLLFENGYGERATTTGTEKYSLWNRKSYKEENSTRDSSTSMIEGQVQYRDQGELVVEEEEEPFCTIRPEKLIRLNEKGEDDLVKRIANSYSLRSTDPQARPSTLTLLRAYNKNL